MSDEMYEVRDRLVNAIRQDLVGPREEMEILEESPFSTYLGAVLYPSDAGILDPENDLDEQDDSTETSFSDPPVSLANQRYPSSLGLTFAVDTGVSDEIGVSIRAARYRGEEDDEGLRWHRIPLELEEIVIPVASPSEGVEVELEPGLSLFRRVREVDRFGVVAVTLVLVNRRTAPVGRRDADCYFQCGVTVRADDLPAFVERPGVDLPVEDEDLETYRLLYRDVRSYAVGHGTSVRWVTEGEGAATEIATEPLPSFDLFASESNPEIPTEDLSMLRLATGSSEEVATSLNGLADTYGEWIEGLQARAPGLPDELRQTAEAHIETCNEALKRIRAGIDLLREGPPGSDVFRAFQLANLAMLRQRARISWIKAGSPTEGPQEDESHRWRPFQIAFILLNLHGLATQEHDDRKLVDLLWFPTGGGKTEAYFGLIAFSTLLRRIRLGDDGAGVTVLMRYTLRLLTIQQFERATVLICALEHIRRTEDDLGSREISIGLWVGRDGTPGTVAEARTALDSLRVGQDVPTGNPIQVRRCPWCGVSLGPRNYWITNDQPRLMISCRNESCDFRDGLPVSVVDEDIYRRSPTLVIATADKFAAIPWIGRGAAHSLFGVDTSTPPPELIIQDELHLISGPLGTLAGLYETAIDLLCTENGLGPKVIASTATIRRAGEQTRALFGREMRQFPPPGLDAGNSFFAVINEDKPSRLYLGALASGTSQSTLRIRIYATLMQTIAETDVSDQLKDPYWTLVGYFNSLRVLGGARIQVLDDVRDRMKHLASDGRTPRQIPRSIELTSREPSSAIPSHLESLANSLPDEETLDYVLATNMISVGVDIDRLGLMVVSGQPQATAEYIQATSRVGRQFPGLVVVAYNASRSRDRSHYESFPTYHQALYRQVESTSVTPFSPRARDRALHAVLLTLARTLVPALRGNEGAAAVEDHLDELGSFVTLIADRADLVEPGTGAAVREELEHRITEWCARAREAPRLVYSNPRDPANSLLVSADQAEGDGLPTPSSLRDVDRESNLYLVRT